jgi:hypothetical protein
MEEMQEVKTKVCWMEMEGLRKFSSRASELTQPSFPLSLCLSLSLSLW